MANHSIPTRMEGHSSRRRKLVKLSSFFKPQPKSKDAALNAQGPPPLQPTSTLPDLVHHDASNASYQPGSPQNLANIIAEHHSPEIFPDTSPFERQDVMPHRFQDSETEAAHASQGVNGTRDSGDFNSGDLWERAFRALIAWEPLMVVQYEKHLLSIIGPEANRGPQTLDPAFIETLVREKLNDRETERLVFQIGNMQFKVRSVGEKIIRTILWANTFIGSALSSQPYASLAWSGVSILLPLMLNNSKQSAAMIDGLDTITHLMQLFRMREEMYLSNADSAACTDFIDALVELYASILEFEIRAINHLSRRALQRGVSATFEKDNWIAMLSKVKAAETKCNAFAALFNTKREMKELHLIEESTKIQTQILTMFQSFQDERQRIQQDGEEAALLQSLSSDYKSGKDFISNRINGTCEWFFADQRFLSWRDSSISSLLWVSAGPGCGKSVLARALVDGKRLSKGTLASTVCYFFFKEAQEERMYGANALSAMLHQLFANPHLLVHGLPSHKRHGVKLAGMFSELWEILMETVMDPYAGEVICVIDALDECEAVSRNFLINELVRLFSREALNDESSFCIKFLVTSRPYDDIETKFEQLSLTSSYLRFDGDDSSEQISQEVNLVIDVKVPVFARSFNAEHQRLIANRLKQMEHRTYLWLFLTIEIIERSRSKYAKLSSIEHLLRDLPSEISEAYEKILDRSPDKETAMVLLKIIVAATRPFTLMEANAALTLATQVPKSTSLEGLDLWPEAEFGSTVKNMCGLLVTVHDGRLSLLHQTARDFLTMKPENNTSPGQDQWRGCLDLASSHSLLCQICLEYMGFGDEIENVEELDGLTDEDSDPKFPNSETMYISGEDSDSEGSCCEIESSNNEDDNVDWEDDFLGEEPSHSPLEPAKAVRQRWQLRFFKYSAVDWAIHYRNQASEPWPRLHSAAKHLCDPQGDFYHVWTRAIEQGYSPHIHDLWNKADVSSRHGLDELIQFCLNSTEGVNAAFQFFLTMEHAALYMASERGHINTLQALLEREANNTRRNRPRRNAVRSFERGDHNDILRLVIDPDGGIDWKPKGASSALQIAVVTNHAETVSFLVERGVDINDRGPSDKFNALDLACQLGYTKIVKILVDAGEGLKAQQSHMLSTYQLACLSGAQDVIELLVSYGISVDGYGGRYGSALQAACAGENNLETVVFLLGQGVDVNYSGGPHGNALNAACRRSANLEVLKTLIDNGAEINPKSGGSMTSLHYASISGQFDIVNILLAYGADMEAEHEQYGTPLQITCKYGTLNRNKIVELLIEKGANINASGGSMGTPLQELCQNTMREVEDFSNPEVEDFSNLEKFVKLLIEAGADVNAHAGRHGSPLHCALARGQYDLVQLLKDNGGVDVDGEELCCCEAVEADQGEFNFGDDR